MMTQRQAIERLVEISAEQTRLEMRSEELAREAKDCWKVASPKVLPAQKINPVPLNKVAKKVNATQEIVLRTFNETGNSEMSPKEIAQYAQISIQQVYNAAHALTKQHFLRKNREGVMLTYELAIQKDATINHA